MTAANTVVCFDLDGTVLDPGGSIRHALDVAVRHGGHRPFAADEVLIGMPLRDILRTRTDDPTAIDNMVEVFRTTHMEESWQLAQFHAGFPAVVQTIRDDGHATAIVTTKGEQEAIRLMHELDITDLWDTIIGDDDVRPIKPDPAPVIAACGRLGMYPRDAVMIGDTSFDMDAGRAAGAWTIGVSWGNGKDWGAGPEGGDVIVHDATQMLDAVREWAARNP